AESAVQTFELLLGIAKEFRGAHADQLPAEALEDHLVLEHAGKVLALDRSASIAQDADARTVRALHDNVDRMHPDLVTRNHPIAFTVEDPAELVLELRVVEKVGEVDLGGLRRASAFDMLDQAQAEIAGLEVAARVERVHDPQLIARATRGDVEHLARFL